jgi:hypothetical protein
VGRNDCKHSNVHKAAVVHAFDVQGMTAEQIVTLAARGQLKAPGRRDRLKPFEIAEATIRNYASLNRRRSRQASTNGGHDHEDGPVPNEDVAVPVEKPKPPRPLFGDVRAPEREDAWSERWRRLIEEHEEELRLTAEAKKAANGRPCRCEEPKPRAWKLDNGAPTCADCRLAIADWETRFPGMPRIIRDLHRPLP